MNRLLSSQAYDFFHSPLDGVDLTLEFDSEILASQGQNEPHNNLHPYLAMPLLLCVDSAECAFETMPPVPPGLIANFAGASSAGSIEYLAQKGWMFCHGQSLSA